MKILLYGLNFAPELTGIGKYTGEMAAWLAAAGHEVRVIAAPPYYPNWSVNPGYKAWRSTTEIWQGVRVSRSPLWIPEHPTGLKRVLHLISFAVLSLPVLAMHALWRPKVVVVIAPALACAPGGWLAARLCGAKAWLHVQDFEIDSAFRLGMLKGRHAQRVIGAAERWVFRRFDHVSTISRRMMELLHSKLADDARTVLFPNWVDTDEIKPTSQVSAYRAELNIPQDAVVALFSGSMGAKQGLELLPKAARSLHTSLPNLVFVLCGDGVCKPMVERDCAGLSNVRVLPLQPVDRLGELLTLADIHLLPQQAGAADLVMPSKFTGMLASGRPVLTTARVGTELANVAAGRGIVTPPDDLPAFVEALTLLTSSPKLRSELGRAARCYAEQHLGRDRVIGNFEQALKRCVGEVPTPIESVGSSQTADEPAKTIS